MPDDNCGMLTLGAVSAVCSFTSENMDPESTMVYAYYKDGSSSPTFLYPKYAMKEEKC